MVLLTSYNKSLAVSDKISLTVNKIVLTHESFIKIFAVSHKLMCIGHTSLQLRVQLSNTNHKVNFSWKESKNLTSNSVNQVYTNQFLGRMPQKVFPATKTNLRH